MGWIASVLVILAIWFLGEKSIWGFVFGTTGNALWIYVGLKRGKQYDLALVAATSAILYLVGLYKWLN